MSRGFASSYRIVLLSAGLLLCFGGFTVRLVWLHVVERDTLLRSITKARHQLNVEPAQRGDILDWRGTVLATSRSMIVLGVDPMSLRPQDAGKWPELARLMALPEPELRRIFNTKYRPTAPAARLGDGANNAGGIVFNVSGLAAAPPAASPADVEAEEGDEAFEGAPDKKGRRPIRWVKLSETVSESLYDEIEKLGIHGVYGQRVYRRVYPNNQLAAHLVGYVDREQRGVAGIEYYADFYLRGQNGWREGERDGRNRELPQFTTRHVPASDGYNVTLSINAAVQDLVEQELAAIAGKFKPLKATIIVSDPNNGFILGMANYPTFNLNEYNKVPKDEMGRMRNIAVADVYEPGSAFKIVAAAAALEEGRVTLNESFNCSTDKITYKGRLLSLPGEDHEFDHPLALPEIISRSSNRGAAQLGMRVGEERFHFYASAFGFGRTLGFPVGGEVPGIFAPWKKWNALDITRIPAGHTIAATALQMHQAMSVIASGGVLYRPQLIRKIRNQKGEVVFDREDGIEINRVVSTRTARLVAEMLVGVASKGGTAPQAAIRVNGVDYEAAGKTGTTQKLESQILSDGSTKQVYSRQHHVASFIGFFPASRPQVAISVIVDDADAHAPGGIAYGGTVAAPSFRSLGEKLIHILPINPPSQLARPPLLAAHEGARQ
ncbi:MAG: penicillin-binding protein 2 [Opitutaceae bacterium]|nr:penicillin-binding protein 2 [Opitutaceae bacterium]